MSMYTIADHALHIRVENEQIELRPWGPNSLRVRARMAGDLLAQDWALLPAPRYRLLQTSVWKAMRPGSATDAWRRM